jgi:hypothetical protein
MKTAIYVEDGLVQVVLTPESGFEKNVLATFEGRPITASMFSGGFYDCRGGWVRQSEYLTGYLSQPSQYERSLILIARQNTEEVPKSDQDSRI